MSVVVGSLRAQTGGATAVSQVSKASILPDSEIRKILVDRIDKYQQSVGIVVGILEPQGRRIIAYGSLDQRDPRPLNGDTVFEIGSNTKVFTSLLLADMVERGEVALADPVAEYPARRRQGAGTRWETNHTGGSGNSHLRAAARSI